MSALYITDLFLARLIIRIKVYTTKLPKTKGCPQNEHSELISLMNMQAGSNVSRTKMFNRLNSTLC